MAVTKPRSRLVNFRLTEEEFQSLRTASAESGARSISDFARSAVLRTFHSQAPEAPVSGLVDLASRLEAAVDKLNSLVEAAASQKADHDKLLVPTARAHSV
jgi:hypothetical protein